jgi:hypothetical protein
VAWPAVEAGGDATSPRRRQWRAAEGVCAREETGGAFYRRASARGGVRALPRCTGRRIKGRHAVCEAHSCRRRQWPAGARPGRRQTATRGDERAPRGICSGRVLDTMMVPQAHDRPAGGPGRRAEDGGTPAVAWRDTPACCHNPPRKILYYRLNQSTLVIK